MTQQTICDFTGERDGVLEQRGYVDWNRAAHWLPANLETAQIELVICAIDLPKLAGVSLLDYRADRGHYLAQMRDWFAVLDSVMGFVPFAITSAQCRHC